MSSNYIYPRELPKINSYGKKELPWFERECYICHEPFRTQKADKTICIVCDPNEGRHNTYKKAYLKKYHAKKQKAKKEAKSASAPAAA